MSQNSRLARDDHKLVRAGIRSLLERMPEVEVVAEAVTGAKRFVWSNSMNLRLC